MKTPKLAITHVIPDLDLLNGGTVTALVGLAVEQQRLNFQVTVVTFVSPQVDMGEIQRLKAEGVRVLEMPASKRFQSLPLLRKTLRLAMQDSEWVHIHGLWEEIQCQAMTIAARMNLPYFVSPHGMLDPWSLSQSRLKKLAYLKFRLKRHLDKAWGIHCTTATEARLLKPLGIRAKPFIIPNGIDMAEFTTPLIDAATTEFRKRYPALLGKQVVLFLSRLHPKKGLDLLLPAFAKLKSNETILVLAGPSEEGYRNQILEQIEDLEITDRVILTGMLSREERVGALGAAQVFILPSYQENFGIAVIESLAAGTPVAISDQVNICESLDGRGVGVVFELGITQVCVAIESLLESSISGKACQLEAAGFSFVQIAKTWGKTLMSK